MRKDIPFLPVKNVMVAIVREHGDKDKDKEKSVTAVTKPQVTTSEQPGEKLNWAAYFINENEVPVENVLITSKGYGQQEGRKQSTSTLRHFIPKVDPSDYAKIEPIDPAIFHLFNEYWVSYYIEEQIFDKKFIFVPEAISPDNLQKIDLIGKEGVLHS